MLKTGSGAIVNMASMGGGVIGVPGLSSYNAAKGEVIGLTRSAAMEFAGQNIRINAVSQGLAEILSWHQDGIFKDISVKIMLLEQAANLM